MALLRTKKSRWIAGALAVIAVSVGTLFGLPTGGQKQQLPINLPSMPSAPYFSPVAPDGVVPANVLGALLIPQNSKRTAWHNYDQGNGQFDREITISVRDGFSSTKSFFNSSLRDAAWKILSSQASGMGYQILALHAGSDGHFWEIGVTISRRPKISGASSQNRATSSQTSVALRLLQYESA